MDVGQIANRFRDNSKWARLDDGYAERVAVAELVANSADDRNRFVTAAYLAILGRPPSPAESMRQGRRLRFLPILYTPRRFLARLTNSWEAIQYQTSLRNLQHHELATCLGKIELHLQQSRIELKNLRRAVNEMAGEIVCHLGRPIVVPAEGTECAS